MYRHNTKRTKSSAQVMIDVELPEDAPGQIWAQQHLMDHTDPGRSTSVGAREEGCLCFKPLFWVLV